MKLADGFLEQHRIIHFTNNRLGASGLTCVSADLPYHSGYTLTPGQPPPGLDYLPAVTPSLTYCRSGPSAPPLSIPRRVRNGFTDLASPGSSFERFTAGTGYQPLSIDYACRPRLRSDLPWADQA